MLLLVWKSFSYEFSDLADRMFLFFLQVYIEGLCHGNLLEEEAVNISNIFKSCFSVPPIPKEMRHKEKVLCLPSGANFVRDVRVKNKLEPNSVVEVICIVYTSLRSFSIVLLILDFSHHLLYMCSCIIKLSRKVLRMCLAWKVLLICLMRLGKSLFSIS